MTPCDLRDAVDRELAYRGIREDHPAWPSTQRHKAIPGDPDDLPLLTRLAARMEPAARRAFLAAVRGAVGVVDIGALAEAVSSGQMSQIEAAAQLGKLSADLRREIMPVLGRTFSLGVAVGIEAVPGGGPAISYGFDLTNPEAIAWVQGHGAELVAEVTDGTRAAIRSLVDVAFREGIAPRSLARDIREVIGLHSRQVDAVQNFRERLTADGVDAAAVDRRTARYADAQLRYRAKNVARTETLTASNEGQQQLWQAARAQGLLDPAKTRRVWIATHDDRLDTEICEPLDETEAPLDGPFKGDIMRPPAHPMCRCSTGLIFK